MKLFCKIILYSLLFTYYIFFVIILGPTAYMNIGKNTIFLESYVADINTPRYSNYNTKFCLDSFNRLGHNNIISYAPRGIFIDRKITIKEVDGFYDKQIIGRAQVGITECSIEIKNSLDFYSYCDTIIHELLHCFGYDHVDDRNDLMFSYSTIVSPNSYLKYAKDLEYKVNRWFNYKFTGR